MFLERPSPAELEDLLARSYDLSRPILVGYGPVEFSTSLAVETHPSIVWDTNRYYADLGVPTDATKKQIRNRYIEADGEKSIRLTMIASVLLNETRRLKYDLTPLGSLFYDQDIEDMLKAQAADEAMGTNVGEEDSGRDWLKDFEPTLEDIKAFEDGLKHDATNALTNPLRDQWSYYVNQVDHHDPDKLADWRSVIATVCYGLGIEPTRLAVGFKSGESAEVLKVGYRVVFFLGVMSAPSEVLALEAVQKTDLL